MQIQIISVSKPEWKEKGKAKWQEVVATFSSAGKTQTKKFLSFDPIFNKAKEMESNEQYNVEMVKGEDGYWKWTELTKMVAGAQEANVDRPAQVTRPSTYETAEERAKKQIYIVRQSSISAALDLLSANGGKKNTPEEVIKVAEVFVQYVFNGLEPDAVQSLIDMTDDLPN